MGYLWLWAACSTSQELLPPGSQQSPEEEKDEVEDSEDGEEQDVGRSCSMGTVPVPIDDPQFCIMQCESAFFEEQALSEVGVLPASNVSFYRAQTLCENTWVEQAGAFMRLPTFAEWKDAGDGTYGEGGFAYPWGDSLPNGECVLPGEGLNWDGVQPCASLSSCQSPFGVWDQIGNLWEWVDSGNRVDIERWFAAREEEGLSLLVEDGLLKLEEGALDDFVPFTVGLSFEYFSQEEGRLYAVTAEPFRSDLPGEGYLMPSLISGMASATEMLPIRLVWDDDRTRAQIEVVQERDEEPIAAKVGGAYYAGEQVRLDTIFWGHVPHFDGTIGFRCIYDWERALSSEYQE
ncbi:MAG: SUMF1/EgtB/PvdO family nonheme iron enzyme [Myxococcota bacterium]|nr:SUMF1/EgtB/PvdO family nonheme iron enzyme [Myxococcota bacterium]